MNPTLQFWFGPRGAGKTEKARELGGTWKGPVLHRSADKLVPPDASWLRACFRESASIAAADKPVLLVLDEVQRVFGWEGIVREEVKEAAGLNLKVLLISSSAPQDPAGHPADYQSPLSLSGAGARYGLGLDEYLYFGSLPAVLEKLHGRRDVAAWKDFVAHSHLETVLGRDVPARVPVAKPVLFRQVLLSCLRRAGEVTSVNRLLSEVSARSHAKTVVGYLKLIEEAHLARTLEKFSTEAGEKSTIPCLIALDNAFVTATSEKSFEEWTGDPELRRRLIKNAVGARLFALTRGTGFEVFHWKDRRKQIDFVVSDGSKTIGFEIRSSLGRRDLGLKRFLARVPGAKGLRIAPSEGPDRIALARFLDMSWDEFLQTSGI
jgi:predicted AAA+ superfamily ATPase